jgi:hypothetical protein
MMVSEGVVVVDPEYLVFNISIVDTAPPEYFCQANSVGTGQSAQGPLTVVGSKLLQYTLIILSCICVLF